LVYFFSLVSTATVLFLVILPVPANPLSAWPDVCNGATQVQSHRVMLRSPPVYHNTLHPSSASPSTWLRTLAAVVELKAAELTGVEVHLLKKDLKQL